MEVVGQLCLCLVCVSVCLSACPPACLPVCLFVCLPDPLYFLPVGVSAFLPQGLSLSASLCISYLRCRSLFSVCFIFDPQLLIAVLMSEVLCRFFFSFGPLACLTGALMTCS